MPRWTVVVLTILLAMLCTTASQATLYFDGDFSSDWSFHLLAATVSYSRELRADPDDYYLQVTTQPPEYWPCTAWAYFMKTSAVYDPQTMGAITSIDYSEEAISLQGWGAVQGTGPAILQDGKYYFYGGGYTPLVTGLPLNEWRPLSATGLQAGHFSLYGGPEFHPDLSAAGSPITFGFWRGTTAGGGTYVAGIDDWTITVHDGANPTVPEPASLCLLSLAAGGIGTMVKRRKKA
jgi:hypothetical protein